MPTLSTVTLREPDAAPSALPPPVLDWHRLVGYRRAIFGNSSENMERLEQAAGDIGAFSLPYQQVVIVSAPEYVEEVLTKHGQHFQKGIVKSLYNGRIFGEGVVRSIGDTHRRQRKMVAPMLGQKRLSACADAIVECAAHRQAAWADGSVVDIALESKSLSLSALSRTIFGCDLDARSQGGFTRDYARIIRFFSMAMDGGLVRLLGHRHPEARHAYAAVDRLNALVYGLIAERRASGEGHDDILTALLQAEYEDGERMSDLQVRDEAVGLLFAGTDPVGTGVTSALYLLMRHPDVYERVRREVDTALGGRRPGYDDLARLPYTLKVFKEALRIYPPAGTVSRKALNDVAVGPYVIPKGAFVWISPWAIHSRPDLYPDPKRFDPDRFAPDLEKQRGGYAFMPFSAGPRMCLGYHLSLMEGQLMLATLTQSVVLTLVPGQRISEAEPVHVGRSRPIRVKVARRTETFLSPPA